MTNGLYAATVGGRTMLVYVIAREGDDLLVAWKELISPGSEPLWEAWAYGETSLPKGTWAGPLVESVVHRSQLLILARLDERRWRTRMPKVLLPKTETGHDNKN